MRRLILGVILAFLAGTLAFLQAAPQYEVKGTVNLAPATPSLTAVDPYANPDRVNPLNAARPFWYAVDANGLTILKFGTNEVLGTVAWPATIALEQPNGTSLEVPAPAAGWVPVSMMVPFPDGESIGPEALEGGRTVAFVVMAHSGYEWGTSDGRFRDQINPNTDPNRESSMMVMVDVSDPAAPEVFAGAILGHNAGQMAWDPSAGTMYVANKEPALSLPPDLASFVSRISAPESGGEPGPPFAPKTLYPLCGKEIEWSGEAKVVEKEGIPVGVPEVWPCDGNNGAGEGEGPFTYKFDGLPPWLTAHGIDPVTGESDGILYGTPDKVGIYTFVATVTDHDPEAGTNGHLKTASAVVTLEVKAAVTEFAGGEMEVEAGTVTAFALAGTGACVTDTTRPGATPVPSWFEIITVPGGCVLIMNSPTLAGEYYHFWIPNFTRIDLRGGGLYPGDVEVGAEVLGTYGFDPLPPGVTGLGGIAYHEVDMIPGEPDKYVVNGEFIGVGTNGQLIKIALPYEGSDTIEEVGPPSLLVDSNDVTTVGSPLVGTGFGNLVVEGDGDIFVAADGAVIKITLTPGTPATETTPATPDTINTITPIAVAGLQGAYLALDSDVEPAVKTDLGGLGQVDHGVLWVTSPGSAIVTIIDTEAAVVSQALAVPGATSLGGVSVDSVSVREAFVPGTGALGETGSGNVTRFGVTGVSEPPATPPLMAVINPAEAIVDPTVITLGEAGSLTIVAIGWPTPSLNVEGALPPGMGFVDNGNGTLTVSGTPTVAGVYTLTATATNAAGSTSQTFTLTVNPLAAPGITSANTATLYVGIASQFKVEATGTPNPILTVTGELPAGVTFHDNARCSPAIPVGCTGSAFLGGLPTTAGTYPLTITAANSQGSVTQAFTLIVSASATTAPAVTTQPVSQTVTDGLAAIFVASASGIPAPTVQWQLSTNAGATWADIAGATNTIYTTAPVTAAMNGYQYRAVFSNGNGSPATSLAAVLTVAAPGEAAISATPALLSFAYNGETKPAAQTVTVAAGPTAMSFSVATNATWLAATPSSGTTPGNVSISVNNSGFAAGAYSATVTITVPGMANSPLAVPVTVVKTESGGNFTFMTGVGSSPEGIALDRNTHHLFIGEMSEGIETGLENPNVADPPMVPLPAPVFHVDPTAGVVLGQATVHSSGEYLAVNSATGLVYYANEITNEIAVIKAATNAVLGYIPLVYENGSYMPYQIAIDEEQNLIYVGTRAPEPPDPGNQAPFPCKAIHEMPEDTYECWNPGKVFVIDGATNQLALDSNGKPMFFPAGSDPEGVVFAAATGKVYASNEDDGTITVAKGAKRTAHGIIAPVVLSTIVRGEPVPGWWQPTCNADNFCGEQGQAALWPAGSVCNGAGDFSGDEADKMAVDPHGDVYIIDDRYRVAKINGQTDKVVKVLAIEGFECPVPEGPEGSDSPEIDMPNTANNIAFSAAGNGVALFNPNDNGWRLYVTSEQNTISVIDPVGLTLLGTITLPGASHLDAVTADPELKRIYITDEGAGLWTVEVGCADDTVCSTCITTLMATSKNKQVQLKWPLTGADHYNIYRSTTNGGPYTLLAKTVATQTVYIDKAVTNGATYYYVVRPATLDETELCQSNQVIGKPKGLM